MSERLRQSHSWSKVTQALRARRAAVPAGRGLSPRHGSSPEPAVPALCATREPLDPAPLRPGANSAFTLIEIIVVMTLLSVIVLGLMAMFNQTQRAFRLGMSQTDVLESGRMATDMIARELAQTTPSYVDRLYDGITVSNVNFAIVLTNAYLQILPGGNNASGLPILRTNVMDDLFFLTHKNQTWTGIGYFVRVARSDFPALPGNVGPVGTLFRFEANTNQAGFEGDPSAMYTTFKSLAEPAQALTVAELNELASNNVSKVLDGVVSFRIQPFDPAGWVVPFNPFYYTNLSAAYLPNAFYSTNFPGMVSSNVVVRPNLPNGFGWTGKAGLYYFCSNAVPASVELEVGILEPQTYDSYKSIPVLTAQMQFLTNSQARAVSHEHVFRQLIAIPNVDRTAY